MSFGPFLIRFLVPVPVGQADNRDGPRLMCALGMGPSPTASMGYRVVTRAPARPGAPAAAGPAAVPSARLRLRRRRQSLPSPADLD